MSISALSSGSVIVECKCVGFFFTLFISILITGKAIIEALFTFFLQNGFLVYEMTRFENTR